MRRIFLLAVSVSLFATPGLAQTVFFFPQLADGTIPGAFQFQTTLIFVNTGADSTITIDFFNSDGPMVLTLSGLGTSSSFTFNLPAGQAFSAQTPGTGTIQVGYARVTSTGLGVGGTAVFTQTNLSTGNIDFDAGVPASQTLNDFSFFLDSLQQRNTGLAMVNPPGAPDANVTLELRDKSFTMIATTPKTLAPGQHLPRFVNELFDDPALQSQVTEMEGVVTVQSDQSLAAVTLRQNGPALTAFPVVQGVASPASSGTFTLLSNGEVSTSLDLSLETRTIIGVIYRLYGGEILLGEVTRGILSREGISHVIPVDDQGLGVSRVEAHLIYAGGRLASGFDLLPN